jgi:hypothetical protein
LTNYLSSVPAVAVGVVVVVASASFVVEHVAFVAADDLEHFASVAAVVVVVDVCLGHGHLSFVVVLLFHENLVGFLSVFRPLALHVDFAVPVADVDVVSELADPASVSAFYLVAVVVAVVVVSCLELKLEWTKGVSLVEHVEQAV